MVALSCQYSFFFQFGFFLSNRITLILVIELNPNLIHYRNKHLLQANIRAALLNSYFEWYQWKFWGVFMKLGLKWLEAFPRYA